VARIWLLPRIIGLTLACMGLVLGFSAAAYADDPIVDPNSDPLLPGVAISGDDQTEGSQTQPVSGVADVMEYTWLPACFDNHPDSPPALCAAATTCANPRELRWTLWGRRLDPPGDWVVLSTSCIGDTPPGAEPVVTDGLVLQAVRRLGLPRLTVHVQPEQATLVNLETIFYTDPPEWTRTVQLLGYSVDVEATVDSYSWTFGDGATMSTSGPGAPYPSKDIVHAYADAHVTVSPRVDVEYAIRYRVDDGEWRTVAETVPASGYPVSLEIREATALLVGD
jgi:hypothetical protein